MSQPTDMSQHLEGPVLVTGASGFIGTHLVTRLLDEGVRVRGLDIAPRPGDPRMEFVRVDLTRRDGLVDAVRGCRVVFHCARWPGHPWGLEAARAINVSGTANLFEACLQAGVQRVVHLSTIAVYGPTRAAVITEETPIWPVGLYAQTKVEAEERAAAAWRDGLPVVVLRPGQAYGPNAPGGTLTLIRRLKAGWPVLVDGGSGIVNPIYVQNLVDAMLAAAAAPDVEGEAFNVADGDVPWREFVGHYARMTRRRSRSVPPALLWIIGAAAELTGTIVRRPARSHRAEIHYLTRRSAFSTQKARTRLGWIPRRSMAEAMAETEHWLRRSGLLSA